MGPSMPIQDVDLNKAQTCTICVPAKVQGLEKFFTVISGLKVLFSLSLQSLKCDNVPRMNNKNY